MRVRGFLSVRGIRGGMWWAVSRKWLCASVRSGATLPAFWRGVRESSFAYVWSIGHVVLANVVYQVCSKGIPQGTIVVYDITSV